MLGAIAGDIIGSVYEGSPVKRTDFPLFSRRSRFTDDTVLTVAVADCLLSGGDYADTLRHYARRYPDAGYGGTFYQWMLGLIREPYNSWGNGSAMRVNPVGYAFDDLDLVLNEARRSAAVTHNHPEGIKGAQAVASAVFLARQGEEKDAIRSYVEREFRYDLSRRLADIRPGYSFEVSCQRSVPEALIAFLESDSVEDAIRKAVSLGGDSDTQACIAGAVAEAYFGTVPLEIEQAVAGRLPLELYGIVTAFREKFM